MTALMNVEPPAQRMVWSTRVGFQLTATANAASGEAGWAAPGQLVVLQGEGFAPSSSAAAHCRVLFDEIQAVILRADATEIQAIVPYELEGRDWVSVTVEIMGQQSSPVRVMMVDANPALFTVNGRGRGQATAENGDGSPNGPSNPVPPGAFLTLYGTGEGPVDRDPGHLSAAVPEEPWLLPVPERPIRVFIDNEEAGVVYAGPMPGGSFGRLMMVVQVPRTLRAGCREVIVQVGRYLSPAGVTVCVGA
jgi:uncharacterized protein (TIGR03437 family)